MSNKREDSNKSGVFLKKKVINDLFKIYLDTKKPISDDIISKNFLEATNGKFLEDKDSDSKLNVDLDGNIDILQGLINRETDIKMKDMFKIKQSDFINRFIGIDVPQESITKICKDVAEEYANLRIQNNRVSEDQREKEEEDAFNYCLINTNHMFSNEIKEYKKAFSQVNKKRRRELQPRLNPKFYLPHWVNISMKLPLSTLNFDRSMVGTPEMAKQMNSFIRKYNKKNGEIPGFFEFLDIENPLANGGAYYGYKKKRVKKKKKRMSSKRKRKTKKFTKKRKT